MATIINAWNISSNSYIFENCTTVVNVNCNNIAWVNNTAHNIFANCPNLKKVVGLNDNITNMYHGFYNCQNLINVDRLPDNLAALDTVFEKCIRLENSPSIPNAVTNMVSTYSDCYNLSNTPIIPENVTNMKWTFYNCQNLTTPPAIPNSVKDMTETFYNAGLTVGANIPNSVTTVQFTYQNCTNLVDAGSLPYTTNLVHTYESCTNLVNAPVIPNSVTTLTATFEGCTSLNTIPTLPHSVTALSYTFNGCTNLTDMPAIPNSVTSLDHTFKDCHGLTNLQSIPLSVRNMAGTFQNCTNLPSSLIILSKDVTNAVDCFNGTSNVRKDVFLPFQYINNTATPTYNAFVAAGYSTVDYSKDNTRIHDMDIANVTVYPIPTDANVILTAPGYTQSGHMITVRKKSDTFPGVPVDWVVNRWGYRNESGNLIPEKDTRIDVTMQKVPFTLTIVPNPADATVTLTADGYTQEGNSISVLYQTSVHWKVEKDGYFTQEDDIIVEDATDLPATLIRTHYNVTVTPLTSGATVTLVCEGAQQTGNSIIAPYMGTVTWTVAKAGYRTETGTINGITEDTELSIKLVQSNNIILESTTPNSYSIVIPETGYYEIAAVGAGGGGAAGADQSKYASKSRATSGGSGAAVFGLWRLNAGTYPATIGAGGAGSGTGMWVLNQGGNGGSTSFNTNTIIVNGGTGGKAIWTDRSGTEVGHAGTVSAVTGYKRLDLRSNGNEGTVVGGYGGWTNGGASVYNGHGRAGQAYCDSNGGGTTAGVNGYLFVRMVSPEIIIERSAAGTQTIEIPITGSYEIIMVGGGGGSGYATNWSEYGYIARGGQAAMISGTATLTAGTYTVTIGAAGTAGPGGYGGHGGNGGDTIFNGNIAGGGKGAIVAGYIGEKHDGYGGTATVVTAGLTGSNGAQGGTSPKYGSYGAGGTVGAYWTSAGGPGYIRIKYLGA